MQFTIGFAATLVSLAVLVEYITEFIKTLVPGTYVLQPIHKQVIALIVSLVLTFSTGFSMFTGEYALLGSLFAAVIASRGSNFTHELIGILERIREELSPIQE